MTEEIQDIQEKEELYHYDNGVLLRSNSSSRYTNDKILVQEFLSLKKEIEDKLATNDPVYVQILDYRRRGSVGRLNKIKFHHLPPNRAGSGGWYNRHYDIIEISDIEIVWDGRKNKCSPMAHEVEYLRDWSGGTIWHWSPGPAVEKPPRIIPYDHLGEEIQVGQFVSFVHRRYGNISLRFGTVSRITDKGGVFVNTLKLRDGDSTGEMKALAAGELVIINDELMKRLVLARLAVN